METAVTYAIIVVFGIIGAGLKYIDEAFDEGIFDKRTAIIVAPFLVFLWVGLSIFDASSGTILLAVLTGVFLTGKVDNAVFKYSAMAVVSLILLSGRFEILVLPFLFLALTGIMDEKGNDFTDKKKTNRYVKFFFEHRCCMKLGVLTLSLTSILPALYLFAFLTFDINYDIIGLSNKNVVIYKTLGIKRIKRLPTLCFMFRSNGCKFRLFLQNA